MTNGAEWFAKLGPEKNGGPKLYCVSGHVKKPGVFEASMGTTLKELIFDHAGGIRDGHQLKAVIPGGSSVPILLPDQLDMPGQLRRRAEGRIDARLGRHHRHGRDDLHGVGGAEPAALLQARVVRQVHAVPRRRRLAATSSWRRSSAAKARCATSICCRACRNNIVGKTLCAFGDAAATPALTTLKLFRAEYEAHIREGRCTVPADWRAGCVAAALTMTPRPHCACS